MSQMALPLARPDDGRGAGFLVTASNASAARMVEDWGRWPVRAALLTGPRRSGRSLLAATFVRASGGTAIDDADRVAEDALFHAWNAAQESGRPLLIVAAAAPPVWAVALPDLATRLAASPHAAIGAPDDVLARALLVRHFEARGLAAPVDLIDWLLARTERSHAALDDIVSHLDRLSLERRRPLSIPLARTSLIEAGLMPGHPEDP